MACSKVVQQAIDNVRAVVALMGERWGAGQLRLTVDDELRARFDRQRLAYNRACWSGDAEEIAVQAAAMVRGYTMLDRMAGESGAQRSEAAQIWEVVLPDGSIGAIVGTPAEANEVKYNRIYPMVWTVREIEAVLCRFPELVLHEAASPSPDASGSSSVPTGLVPIGSSIEERTARCRALRATAMLLTGSSSLVAALARAETDDAALREVERLVAALAPLPRRRLLSVYAVLHGPDYRSTSHMPMRAVVRRERLTQA
jgi:hypothetical protein